MEPRKVPEKLEDIINKKILVLIAGLAAIFQTFVVLTPETQETEYVIASISIINPLIASILAFHVSRLYGKSMVFGKSYFILAIALLMMFAGESTWYLYIFAFGVEDPYPSIADVFFFLFYPLAALHIIMNVEFFKTKISLRNKLWIVIMPLSIVTVFSFLSLQDVEEANFDYYYGLLFVSSSSILLSLGLVGTIIFRGGVLGTAWILLLVGILLTTTGDLWYYYLEIPGFYYGGHPVELLWYTSYWTITYALYKHKKII